jgi:single-strand DNA-binding protein
MINKVTLIGNLGKDPEIRRLENGTPVAKFTIATNENYKDANGEWQKQTEWHDVVAWRGLAEYAEKNAKKGTMVYVEGKLTHRKYTDSNNIERYITEVLALALRSLEKRENTGSFPTQEPPYASPRTNYSSEPTANNAVTTAQLTSAPTSNFEVSMPETAPVMAAEGGDELPF